jgi:putative copper export protein
MSAPEPLIEWPQPILEFLGFVAAFLATGAIGFRLFVLRPWAGSRATADDLGAVARTAARRSALLGLIGSVLATALYLLDVSSEAAEGHATFGAQLTSSADTLIQLGLLILTVVGFALALSRVRAGWYAAAAGVVLGVFLPAFSGKWLRLVNPIHMFAAGMWIGTLFQLVVAGILVTLRSGLSPERRGAFVRDLTARFSPLALTSAGVLATFGVITAWRHLKTLPALWTTPYGYALIVKLCLVAGVLALGAFNFRRQRPLLGTELGARSLRRSATAELTVALLVLVVTSILVSLPTPKP